ncbi:FecR domain-containing protein [Allomuricauda taeanensis]|uniref:FecR family protein n=1 Tax=Flagellimonas taeanensis TaxID=1005926 RepID=UPI002E7AEE0E|nr:FecR domain-containing protein [Allomuricauda taeanensis]MEE1964343.1 FecR domain-containing protein [Allomuricauda taeanensis]
MIVKIILKKLKGHLSEEEEILFEKWLAEDDENLSTFQRLTNLQGKSKELREIDHLDPQKAWEIIQRELHTNKSNRRPIISYAKLMRYAAIFVGVVGLSLLYRSFYMEKQVEIAPDPTAIRLELGNGETRILSQSGAMEIVTKDGDVLGSKADGVVDYSQNNIDEDEVEVYNTLHIPNGKMFKIVLSDGTTVNLNAGSTLEYPIKFIKGQHRKVTLIGEAFFDVKKDENSPFIVTSRSLDIRVLGTKFNVTSYPEDTDQKTVLVEGSVSLYKSGRDYDKDDSILLTPGDMGSWEGTDKKISVKQVDTELYTSWMQGKLVLKGMKFKDIEKRLERHYGVTIQNKNKELEDRVFTATFDVETIEEVLNTFVSETSFDYVIENDQITILE